MASKSHGIRTAILARRAESCARILELLANGPMTTSEVVAEIKQGNSTVRTYLSHMNTELRQIHIVGRAGITKTHVWALGPGAADSRTAASMFDQYQVVTPARQLGIQRDPMIAALYGPAPQPQ